MEEFYTGPAMEYLLPTWDSEKKTVPKMKKFQQKAK